MTRGRGVLISASILNADFSRLDRVVHKLERAGVDRLHLDVMDGHFVDNLTFGPDVVAAFRRLTAMPLDVHLMISEPSRYLSRFLEAEPDTLTFHVEVDETDEQKGDTLRAISAAGRGAGLAMSPGTPVVAAEPFADLLDLIMVMTVEPGWGGQGFLPEAAAKIHAVRAVLARAGRGGLVHVDGGVNRDTAEVVGGQGADVCVVGSALFQRGRDAADEVRLVRDRARQGRAAAGAPGAVGGTAAQATAAG
ncbi:ribulose-phosphate 3-epimerase [soil metagenome]